MNKQNTANTSLILAGIGLLLLSRNKYSITEKESIGDYGYSEIEIWIRAGEVHQHGGSSIRYLEQESIQYAQKDAKLFLATIDKIRRKFGFQELGKVYVENTFEYNSIVGKKTKRRYLVTSIQDDQLTGIELKKLFLNEIKKLVPNLKRITGKEFQIRIIKNDVN